MEIKEENGKIIGTVEDNEIDLIETFQHELARNIMEQGDFDDFFFMI